MGKKTVTNEKVTSRDIIDLVRHFHPEKSCVVWSVNKFVPDHCPNCGREFKTSDDYAFSAIDPKLKRYYMNHFMREHGFGIAVCRHRHCGKKTAMVEIASCYVATKRRAETLIRENNYTSAYLRAVTPKEKKELIAEGVKLHSYGIGLQAKKIDVPKRGKSKKDFTESERRYKANSKKK